MLHRAGNGAPGGAQTTSDDDSCGTFSFLLLLSRDYRIIITEYDVHILSSATCLFRAVLLSAGDEPRLGVSWLVSWLVQEPTKDTESSASRS